MRVPVVVLLMLPLVVTAQSHQGMSEEDMQKMMQQMQGMKSCMENIDQEEMQKLERRSRKMEAEIRSLCARGERDEAQSQAMKFGLEMSGDPTIKALGACGEMMKGMMPQMLFNDRPEEPGSYHVCD
ncbi:MAG: hypothetical protein GY703_12735 [Gammaproteobacteria bacterium]|nr:hypothetical protein [Gammaproteobacteria bacterium]